MYGDRGKRHRPPKCFVVTLDMKVRGGGEHPDGGGSVWVRKGSICVEQDNGGANPAEHQWVKVLDNRVSLKLEKRFLLEITSDLSGLLEPVDPEHRFRLLENPALLTQLATLPEGAPLWVTLGQDELAEAQLRYVGPVSSSSSAVYFGVQLKGSAKGRGVNDGSYNGRQLFLCPEDCGLFVPVSHVQQRQWLRSARNGADRDPGTDPHHHHHHDDAAGRPRGKGHVSRRSNGNAIHSSNHHHSNGHQDKPSRRISLHPSQHLPPQTAPPRSMDPPPAQAQAPVRGSTPPGSSLQAGQRVHVSVDDALRPGEVRWCGFLPGRASSGVYVGVQLDDPVGDWNGSFNSQKLCTFTAPEHGVLVSLRHVSVVSEPKPNRLITSTQALKSMLKSALPPSVHRLSSSPTSLSPVSLPSAPAPRAALMPPNKLKPPPLPPPKPALKPLPPPLPMPRTNASPTKTDPDQSPPMSRGFQEGPEEARDSAEDRTPEKVRRRGLEPGSMVEVNDPPQFGVIRWIGRIEGIQETVAGIELEQEVSAGTDGSYLGERYFHCAPNKGLFVKLRKCRRDSRFPEPETPVNQVERCNSIAFAEWGSERVDDHTPPAEGEEARQLYQGWKRGIQGHLNSCYLDASLFSLFSCCSSADWVLFWPINADQSERSSHAQDLLRCEIVNPLRRFGYVCASKTMALRRLLEAANSDAGFTNQEKDPEEFLNKLFQLLTVEPLLKIRSMSQKPQQCHLYQLFPPSPSPSPPPRNDTPHSPIALLSPPAGRMRVSSVQALLESSFYHSGLKFVEAPSCLLLLMPRFGKDFKMYDAILPSLSIDITDLLDDSLRQCSICESVAEWECPQCYDDPDITPGHLKQYCPTCNTQVHSHKKRSSHRPLDIAVPQELHGAPLRCARQRMSLFAVTCIETSHYVSFVRHGSEPQDWLFFDSMADREGGENGFNVPRVKACPEVGRYLGLSEDELGRVDSGSLKEPARRLLCDAHMCLYHSPELSLYK
ncbi:ubiquitin carboxyl-terminal hydrolase CYLD [Eucyclogobius newberryi]|uniref:ubiquitin carboxyl-terminal hydrolase CYLD n=1 Tax=Eucyclogobius newberryi TaxID=166745 RepID=UPI003B593D88